MSEEDQHDPEKDNSNKITTICEKYCSDGTRIVSKMPLSIFKQCLVNHFHIRLKNDIVWPQHVVRP